MASPSVSASGPGSKSGYPVGAAVLNVVGGLLMMLEGVYFAAYGSSIPSGSLIPSLRVSGYLAVVEGALVLGLGLLVFTWPSWHRVVGIGSISLGLLSLFSGGGFLLGAFLAWIGGVIAIYHAPRHTGLNAEASLSEATDLDPVVEADILDSESQSS